jgi:flagellar biogenesis protein FliO
MNNIPNNPGNYLKNLFSKINKRWLMIGIVLLIFIFGFIYFYTNSPKTGNSQSTNKNTGAQNINNVNEDAKIDEINKELGTTKSDESNLVDNYANSKNGTNSIGYLILKIVICLSVIIVLIYLTILLLRFINKSRYKYTNKQGVNQNLIKIVESVNFSQNKSVKVLEVGGKFLVLGVGEKEINLLCKISEEDIFDNKKENVNEIANNVNTQNFKNIFLNYFKK